MAKRGRWLLGRLPGQISESVCVRPCPSVCSVSQSHASPLDNGIAGPHQGSVVAPSRDPIMPVPLRVATWKRGPTVITAWPSGGRTPCQCHHVVTRECHCPACPLGLHLLFFSSQPSSPSPLCLCFFQVSASILRKKCLSKIWYQNQEENKRIPCWFTVLFYSQLGFDSMPWQQTRLPLITF